MMLWQRGPPPQHADDEEYEIGRDKALKPEVAEKLHQ
jgi:hypothetical protein